MTQYAVVAFPESLALIAIETLRRRFDPQAALIPAHLTIVFPFVATASIDQLRLHLETAVCDKPGREE